MLKFAVFASGGGTDLQSIMDAVDAGSIRAELALVVSDNPHAYALTRAEMHGIRIAVFPKNEYASRDLMFEEITSLLREVGIEYVVLAGFLTILTPNIVSAYTQRIVNIHPSLIPKYCGDGFYGMRVHRAVIDNGEIESGATVHYVDEGTDTGAIIAQERVPVLKGDTAETLAARVLDVEHKLLPATLAKLFNEK